VALRRGDVDAAFEEFRRGLSVDGVADVFTVAHLLAGVAAVAGARGRSRDAAVLWGAVERLEEQSHRPIVDRELYERGLGELDADAVAEGRALELDAAVALALGVVTLPRRRADSAREGTSAPR
jgi:hypothetical protein